METWDEHYERMLRPHLALLEPSAPIVPDLDLRGAGLDSLALIELVVAIEDTYQVEFLDELLTGETFDTAGSLWQVVDHLRSADARRQPA